MKLYTTITFLIVIANSQCAPFEGLFERVRESTSDIKQDISGMFSRGRSLIFGDNHEEQAINEGKPATHSQGLVDRISLKIHNVSQGVRSTVQHVLKITDRDENGKGLIANVYDGVKNKVDKVTGFLLGDNDAHKIKEGVDTALTNDITSGGVNNIVDDIRKNVTKVTNSNEFDGSGLIDIRAASGDLAGNAKEYSENVIDGLDAGYDKVEEDVKDSYKRGKESLDNFRQRSTDSIDKGKKYFNDKVDKLTVDTNKL